MAPIPVQEAGAGGPAPSKVYRTTALVLRVLTFICLLISVAVLATNTITVIFDNLNLTKFRFKDIYSYRYLFGTIIVGLLYSALQTVATLYHISTGNQLLKGDTSLLFDFYGDKVVSYILATGAAAALGATKDLKVVITGATDKFFNKGNVCAGLVLIAFSFTAISSVFSSFALPKRVVN